MLTKKNSIFLVRSCQISEFRTLAGPGLDVPSLSKAVLLGKIRHGRTHVSFSSGFAPCLPLKRMR